ncbi:unnamed protein product [Coffea canephora]|uniref:DH200=94 genomic scaffold, scaffold_7747 n=1 Tax=Coffea canephora TaxID=49390 RepID=A0A068VMT0_COFCA|nr:unnamed protein product [Coffea canephora]
MKIGTKGDFIPCDDILKLPYINKLVEETMRLGNLSPLFSELGKGMLITKVKDGEL